jgi:hypothetical protein
MEMLIKMFKFEIIGDKTRSEVLGAKRTTEQSSSEDTDASTPAQYSPYYLVYGREMRLPIEDEWW